ncbi:MAG: hypothetical protein K6T74_03800 [Geminicoccaceae bacterium]|nr:hypothetical protein [Geminicoccaceae bacterium]
MRTEPRLLPEIDGLPGWSWRALDREDLPLAWPLARLAGIAPDLGGWLALAERWIARAAVEGGGLGALVNPGGLLVGLERHRPLQVDGRPTLLVDWYRTLEVTPSPRCLEALVAATSALARRSGCLALELTGEPGGNERLAALAGRLGLVERGGRWRCELDSATPPTARARPRDPTRPAG